MKSGLDIKLGKDEKENNWYWLQAVHKEYHAPTWHNIQTTTMPQAKHGLQQLLSGLQDFSALLFIFPKVTSKAQMPIVGFLLSFLLHLHSVFSRERKFFHYQIGV
ncbi:hypothetical protein ILYODFUR_021930 [Ilyodon furcidens]|uniref:Uncharacterized protein n=1 Tax=Ilyodon furcidens TaxID=33524 RepID=A0ABV0V6S3_9TELE